MKKMDRRTFNRGLGAAAVGTAFLGSAARRTHAFAEGPRVVRIGVLGTGWWGMLDLKAAFKAGGVEAVALCDVDREHLEKAATETAGLQGGVRPKTYGDWREFLKHPGMEAVIIATPPHWHALPFIAALQRSLDVYLEKPVAYDIREAQAMTAAARRAERIVQVGFQRRQSQAFRDAAAYLRDGSAGRLVQVDAQINYAANPPDATPQAPPPALDWETWCGPAPKLPYAPNVGHFAWRLEEAYGNGHLVDWGIHWIDRVRVALGEGMPKAVQAAGGLGVLKGRITTPDTLVAQFEFERCPLVWRHRIWGAAEWSPETDNAALFYGEKETVVVTDDNWTVVPRGGGERRVFEAKTDVLPAHVGEFLEAVRTRKPPSCSVEDAARSTAAVQLAMIAYKTGARVAWDDARGDVASPPAAAGFLKRDYRAPYVHPGA
jgi:predicted dehydrogenase